LGHGLGLVGFWLLDYSGDTMSISEYEFFGVSSHANAKNTRCTDGEGVSGMAKTSSKTQSKKRYEVIMVKETEVKSAVLCTLALLAGLCCVALLGCTHPVEESAEYKDAEVELIPLPASNIDWENVA
tara:strand:- start:104 stop:484 length:381 start_codon:yes stop_codon:yes gene_type:complete